MSLVRVIAAIVIVLGLGACSSETALKCGNHSEYLEAASTGTLRIPDDLSVPDESDSLSIPGALPTAAEVTEGEGATACLEESPALSSSPQP